MKSPSSRSRPNADAKGINHVLHLYTPKVDKYAIQGAFLASIRNDEEIVYVTAGKPKSSIRELNFGDAKLRIINPEELRDLKIEDGEMRIIIDAGSITKREKINEIEERESYINELGKKYLINCLCTHDISKLNPDAIKQIAKYHNKLRLTTSDLTILSEDMLDKSRLSDDSIEKMVKNNLETIILALLQKKPMCGTDIIGTIHLEFNVLLSPGTIYPLLQSLKEKELLTSEKNGKAKMYAPARDAELKIRSIINEDIQARKFLNHYIQQEPTIEEVS